MNMNSSSSISERPLCCSVFFLKVTRSEQIGSDWGFESGQLSTGGSEDEHEQQQQHGLLG